MYTEKEILQILNMKIDKRQGQARLIPLCARAGLEIRAVSGGGKGKAILYEIIEDHRNLEEKWVDCIYDNRYEVSDQGKVRRKVNLSEIGFLDGKGYRKVAIGEKTVGIHRVVYFSFNPQDFVNEKILTIDHINGIRTDNRLSNLQTLSRLENIRHMDEQQTELKGIMAKLLNKYGYEGLKEKLLEL